MSSLQKGHWVVDPAGYNLHRCQKVFIVAVVIGLPRDKLFYLDSSETTQRLLHSDRCTAIERARGESSADLSDPDQCRGE